jgi:hypothetical protein
VPGSLKRPAPLGPGQSLKHIALAAVAEVAQGLKIFECGFPAFAAGVDVVDLQLDAGGVCGGSAAGAAAEMVALQDQESEAVIDVS